MHTHNPPQDHTLLWITLQFCLSFLLILDIDHERRILTLCVRTVNLLSEVLGSYLSSESASSQIRKGTNIPLDLQCRGE